MRHTPPLIDDTDSLARMLAELEGAQALAVDAEMDSFYSYREKICLIQVSSEQADYLVDPLAGLDLGGLGRLFADRSRCVVFHAGENDIPLFRRQYGFEFTHLFDTYLAARVLGYPQCGLAALLGQHFQVTLDKKFQMADWRIRPLSPEMEAYARTDTRFLLELRDRLLLELEAAGRVEEAQSEFDRACLTRATERSFDPTGWSRLRGARGLAPRSLAILDALYRWRDEEARRQDLSPFRVLPDDLLVQLSHAPPASSAGLRESVRHQGARARAEAIMSAIQGGIQAAPLAFPKARPSRGERLTPAQEAAYQRLRGWRNQRAEERGVEPDRVASNRVLRAVVEADPTGLEGLEGLRGMDPWRIHSYGAEILHVLQQDHPAKAEA